MKEEKNYFSKQLRIGFLLTEAFAVFNILRFMCVPELFVSSFHSDKCLDWGGGNHKQSKTQKLPN